MFKNYFRTAFRNLKRNKVYSFINIAGLSLGLACAMLIMLYVKDEISYDRFHPNVGQIYRVVNKNVKPDGSELNINSFSGYFQGPRFAAGIPEIVQSVRFRERYIDSRSGPEIKTSIVFETDSSFFEAFNFPMIYGNPRVALKDPASIVISEDMAMQRFGTPDAIGKTILLKKDDRFEPRVVTGVTKNCPQNSTIRFDMLVPMKVSPEDEARNENWFNFFMNTFIVLRPGADVKSVEAKMNRIFETDALETIRMLAEKYDVRDKTVYFLQPFTDIHLNKTLAASNGLQGASNPVYSYILSGIAIFILLIACINFVNLTVARSVKRAKEIGVRKVVGGDRKQLIFQFLGESFIICFIAFTLALALVEIVLPVFNHLSNKALALSYLFDVKLIAGYVTLFILTGLLSGFYPAIVLSAYQPVQTLYSRFVLAGKNYLQRSLVVLQFTLASFLIIATLTVYSQFNYLTHKSIGYDDSHLAIVEKWPLTEQEAKRWKEELMQNANIIDVAPKNGGDWSTEAKVNGQTTIAFAYETVDASYIPMLKIPIVKGRNFTPDLKTDANQSVLINESFARKAGWQDPIGQTVDFWYNNGEKYSVVGVVKDHHFEALNKEIKPQLFTMKPNGFGKLLVKIKPGGEAAALNHMEAVFKKLFPLSPYTYRFKDQENLRQYEAEAKWKQIMLFGALLTIFISCIGLFGLSVLAAEKRTKEIGIRKVLGASVGAMVGILSRDFIRLVTIALFIAIPLSWTATAKWLENYPYRIVLGWPLFAGAALLVIMIALFTVSFQAIRAAVANPVSALRSE